MKEACGGTGLRVGRAGQNRFKVIALACEREMDVQVRKEKRERRAAQAARKRSNKCSL